jgi:uncharacterized membrane protein
MSAKISARPRRRVRRPFRPFLELLEDRVLLASGLGVQNPQAAAPAIVVGRTLSSYTTGGIQNNQETITFTVYNEQADPVTGVLLTDTLQPGVTVQSASAQPDQNGQSLAWSLGTIHGFDRASVTLTVNLPSSVPLQLDSGAQAFATLNAGAVSNSTPAATLRQGSVDPSLLASTPDANTTDPFIQEEAAKLNYDPQQIFRFLHEDVGYNAYAGSVRGARGTLWSGAGNALDVANLGVALMRASGVPAQYEQGTLSQGQAQQLILGMFPARFQTVGNVPAGTQTADPANDPQLLSVTESHYWLQFDAGNGMQDADPLVAGAAVGQAFTPSTGTFSAVPDGLRAKTEVQLTAEIYSQASAAFGLSPLQDTVVLDQTFADVDLVGRPITIGNFVSQSGSGFLISAVTNTYTPYLVLGDDALANAQLPEAITGKPYQEVLTNFPLGNQVLTGLFLNVTLTGPGAASQTYTETLVDRIGYAARQGLAPAAGISADPTGPPIITPYDLTTLNVLGAVQSDAAAQLARERANQELAVVSSDSNATTAQQVHSLIELTRAAAADFAATSDQGAAGLAGNLSVAAYFDAPRITAFSTHLAVKNNQPTFSYSIDLVRDSVRAVAAPGQSAQAALGFAAVRGLFDSFLEAQSAPAVSGSQNLSSVTILQQSLQQGIPLAVINASNLSRLQTLDLPADALARITTDVQGGLTVIVPAQALTVNAARTTAWLTVNPATGEVIAESADGYHQGLEEWTPAIVVAVVLAGPFFYAAAHAGALAAIVAVHPGKGVKIGLANFLQDRAIATALHDPVPGINLLNALILLDAEVTLLFSTFFEPPTPDFLLAFANPTQSSASSPASISPTLAPPSPVGGEMSVGSITVSNQVGASWTSSAASSLLANTLRATGATVTDSKGSDVGSGEVGLDASVAVPLSISGNNQYTVSGMGTLSFYGPAESSLGVSGNWDSYSATVTGNTSITLTTDGLTLNGQALPAGTYTITASSATVSGSGPSTSPSFSGSVAVTATNSTINLGSGSGSATAGGNPLDVSSGATLTGYSGSITVAAGGSNLDDVTLHGDAANVLTVSATPNALTTDQDTPVTFRANVQTSLADTYNLTAQAPPGWAVAIDGKGNVTATPAAGLQGGTYPIRIIAQSATTADLVAQATVNVTITPTQPGVTLAVDPDPQFTVPLNGAQLPTAFRAQIRNTGPAADTFNLSFSNVPSGFTVLSSATSLTIPAGQTGIVGIYLRPSSGPLPAPGTPASFTVTATSASDATITATQQQLFTMPAVDAVTLASTPAALNTTPGTPVTATLTLTNAGNVPENVALSAALPAGLTASALTPVSLAVGQLTTQTITLTPDTATPLNSTLDAAITATFGPSGSPQTQTVEVPVQVVVPGAAAVADAAVAAGQLGNTALANRLHDLGTALTDLVQNPASDVSKSQALAAIDSIQSQLAADPFQASFAPALATARAALAGASTAADVQAAVSQLGNALTNLDTVLSDEAKHRFTLGLTPSSAVALPGTPAVFDVALQNTGSQATTYDLSVSGLPAGVTAAFSQPSITLNPGDQIPNGGNRVTLSLSETGSQLFATGFTVTATPEQATELTRSTAGALTVRPAFASVTEVDASPTFTDPGGTVHVTAKVLNAANAVQQAQLSYTVTDPSGKAVFTSTPMPLTLGLQASLATVDLGTLDTTGFANGSYPITVTVADASGKPLPGGTGTGTLLVGSPLTAALLVSPTTLPPGNGTVTDTLTVHAQTSFPPPLTLAGAAATDSAGDEVAVNGTLAYVAGSKDVSIIDVSNPASPTVVKTFGANVLTPGSYNIDQVTGHYLLVASGFVLNASSFHLLIYDLTDPLNPTLVSNTAIKYPFYRGMVVQGNTVFVPIASVTFTNAGHQITAQNGDVVAVDISDPTKPKVAGVLFNPGSPLGGNNNVNGLVAINNQVAYAASTTATGGDTQSGTGRVLIVNTADPTHLSLAGTLDIPGTVQLQGIAVQGNRALVVGSTGGWVNPFTGTYYGLTGNTTLTILDITDPQNPQILGTTLVTPNQYPLGQPTIKMDVLDLGNGLFAASNVTDNGQTGIMLINAGDPNNIVEGTVATQSLVQGITVAGNQLYAATPDGLSVYNINQVIGDPVTVSVPVPHNGVSVVANSFNQPPTQVVTGTDFDTLIWKRSLGFGTTDLTFSWQSSLANLQPGEARAVAGAATVSFTDQGTPGTIPLAPAVVSSAEILGLSPAAQMVAPAAPATYDVSLQNPTGSSVTYTLSVEGVPSGWVNIAPTVTVAANGSADVPLTLTSDEFAATKDYPFTVAATADTGFVGTVQGMLTLAGPSAIQPDPQAHGVVIDLTPASASAGQGTPAQYVLQVTNTGSVEDTFALAANLPAGMTGTFSQTTVDVPPGASNFRDVTLTLTPQAGTTPGSNPFTVTATSTSQASVTATASGNLQVLQSGVRVALSPSSAAPGSGLQLTVTNTGQTADTFDLALGGPAALVSSLGSSQVTLAAGASQVVPITTGAVSFAVPGELSLSAAATSHTNSAVKDQATAALTVPTATGLTTDFSPSSQVVAAGSTATFVLQVHNTGNAEDSYTATINGTSGPVSARLLGLDGQPTQALPLFRLPGLASGAIALQVDLNGASPGSVTVRVNSLSNGNLAAIATALVTPASSPAAAPAPTPAPAPSPAQPSLVEVSSAFSGGLLMTAAVFSNGDLYLAIPGFSLRVAAGVRSASLYLDGHGQLGLAVVMQGSGLAFALDSTGLTFLGVGLLSLGVAFDGSGQPTVTGTFPGLRSVAVTPMGVLSFNLGSFLNVSDGAAGPGGNELLQAMNGTFVEAASTGASAMGTAALDAGSTQGPAGLSPVNLLVESLLGMFLDPLHTLFL